LFSIRVCRVRAGIFKTNRLETEIAECAGPDIAHQFSRAIGNHICGRD
jgi:hypothetical protein